ncbi:MAG: PAS domain S-box protein, partial [Methanospirillum sp.]|nr:PAS domain S-box protein [Methanospirillum sp.]
MGTPDRRYILEISRTFDRLLPNASKSSYNELIHTLPEINPDIMSVSLYNSEYEVVSRYSKEKTVHEPEDLSRIIQVFKQRKSLKEVSPERREVVRYTFLPVEDTEAPSASEMNLVARIVYSTKEHDAKALEVTLVCILYLVLTAIIAVVGALLVSRYLSRPINRIVEDINSIASGDLDHHIRSTGSSEFQQIETAITRLVENLKGKICDLKTREEELLDELGKRWRAEENYRRLFESAHEAIFILQDMRILNCNIAASEFLGRERQEIIGKNICDFSPLNQDDGTKSVLTMKNNVSQAVMGNTEQSDWSFVRADGTLIETEMHIIVVISGDSVVLMAIFRDVSEIREMRRREIRTIVQIEENLVQLATINDQIRNPLGVITLLNDMQRGEYAETINDQIKAIDALIHEVDKQFVESDKVRMFLKKHYGINLDDDPQKER